MTDTDTHSDTGTDTDQPPVRRSLSGIFIRVQRDGEYQSICFEDCTEQEQHDWLMSLENAALIRLAKALGNTIRELGDTFNIESAV